MADDFVPGVPEDFTRAMAQTRHELRTPLNHIIGYSELLLDEAADLGIPDLTGDLSKIRDAGRRLLGMLNALLTPGALASRVHFHAGTDATGANKTAETEPVATAGQGDVAKLAFAAILAPLPLATPVIPTVNPILVVDDDEDNRAVLGRLLAGMGYAVVGAPDGQVALEILASYPCDAVFLDIMMPVMDGYAALTAIRADPNLRHLPVIMVSALDEIQVVARCIEAGAEDYLPKPFNPTLLKARLAAALEKKRLRDGERALYAQLSVAHEKLQTSERLRDDMTRLLVQDLRLPLGSLVTSLEMSASLSRDESPAEQRDFLNLAIRGSNRVLSMVSGLLDIAKAETGVLPLARTLYPPLPVAQLAVLQVAELARAEGVSCELVSDETDFAPVYVDGTRVRQAVINLLENAVKHAPEGGCVTLRVERASLAGGAGAVAFRVSDTGAAVSPAGAEALFDRFAQAGARHTGERVSPGLALTFARSIAEAHGGELRVESDADRTDFLLLLPQAGAP